MPDLLTRDSIETTEPVTRIRRSRTWTVGTSGFMFIAPTTLDGEWILDPAWGPRVAIASEISVTEPAQRPGLVRRQHHELGLTRDRSSPRVPRLRLL